MDQRFVASLRMTEQYPVSMGKKRGHLLSRSIVFQIAQLVEREIRCSPAAITHKSQRPGIDKISEQNAVARFHFGSHRVGRMPSVIGNCKCLTAVRRERHLRLLWFSAVGKNLVKNSSDMQCRVVRRQIKLDCDAFPKAVGMFENAISGNIACEDWHGIQ